MTTRGGRTKIPPTPVEPDDEPTYYVKGHWDYGAHAPPGLKARQRAFFARRDELKVIARMLVRHHGFSLGRARGLVSGQPGAVVGLSSRKGRPPKPHLIRMADVADEVLSRGERVHWDVVHRNFVALNHPGEMRRNEYHGEAFTEPRDSENWQRAVRRIRNRLRAAAAALARQHG